MAGAIKGITVEIGGNTTKLDKALKDVNKTSKNLQSELKGINTLLKMDPSNVTLLKQKQDLLTKSIENTKTKLDALKQAQKQVQEQFDKGKITEEQYRDFQREIVATENKLENLTKELKNFGSVGAQEIANVGKKMEEVGGKIETAGKKISKISGIATVALGGASKIAIDFESAWTGVTKTVNGSEEQLETIKQGILDLSQSTASSAEEIAAVAENAGQLGVKTENILAFTETMVRLGDSTNLSADEASSAIAKLYNIMGGDINTVDAFGATIVALGNNFATTEADILNMATRVAASGKQIGLTEQEILALSASLSSVGLEAEAGGSAISQIMTQVDKDVALNTEKLSTWADVAGMSVSDFKSLWEKDAMSAIQKLVGGMGDASKGGENLNVILDELGITSIRQSDTMKRLSGASDLLSDSVNLSNKAWGENSALTEESDKRYATTGAKIAQLKGKLTELCVTLGETLLPIIEKLVNGLGKVVDWFTNLSPVAQKVILAITGIIAVAGPLLIFIGKIISSVGSIMTIAPKFVPLINGIKTAVSGLFSLIMAHPIIAVIVGVIALIITLYTKCEWFRNGVNNILNAIKNGFLIAINWISEKFRQFGAFIGNVVNSVKNFFVGLWQNIVNIFTNVKNWFVTNIAQPIANFYTKWIAPVINKLIEMVKKVVEIIIAIFVGLFNLLNSKVIQPIFNKAKELWNKITTLFGKATSWVRDKIITPVVNAVKNMFDKVRNFASSVWSGIKNIFAPVGSWFREKFSQAWTAVKNVFSKFGSFFGNLWTSIKNKFKSLGTSIGDAIGGAVKSGINRVISWVENTINRAIGLINGAINLINKLPGVSVGKLSKLSLPRLARGAVIDRPTVAEIGEDGAEAIVPLENNTAWIRKVAKEMNDSRTAGASDMGLLLSKLDRIYERLNRFKVLLNSSAVVGELLDDIDAGLADKQLLSSRGG